VLDKVAPADQLRGLAGRKAKADEFKTIRNALVDEEVAKGWVVHKRNRTTTRLRKPKAHDKRFEDRVWTLMCSRAAPQSH
jgi:DNA sulfur modification protein DndB